MNSIRKKVICGVIAGSSLISSMSCMPAFASTNIGTEKNITTNDKTESQVKVYVGNENLKSYGIEAQGSGSFVMGNINGTITAHSMEELYQAYNLTSSDDYNTLFSRIKSDKTRIELVKVFENSKATDLKYNLNFSLQGNDDDITGVYITEKSVILDYNGQKMKFISTRSNDSGAVTDNGESYKGYTAL